MASETLARLRTLGLKTAMPTELLALAVSKTDDDVDRWVAVARELILSNRKLRGLSDLSVEELQRVFDLDEPAAKRLLAMFILGQKVGVSGNGEVEVEQIDGPEDIAALLDDLRHERQEHFVAVYLDSKNVILRVATIHIGTANASIVGLREIFREAVREGAVGVIVAHNHPSGDPEPSPEDIQVTRKIVEAGELLDIDVLDHVIIGERRWVSLKRQKLM
ncbi:MAG: DNA repair protein RadC [Armatimonadetes bacterium]|nr:DNA repair protein RadC [Armatimonadota bacterium]